MLVLLGAVVTVVAGGFLIGICFAKGHRIMGGVSVVLAVSPVGWWAALGWLSWAVSLTNDNLAPGEVNKTLLMTGTILLPSAVGAILPARTGSRWTQGRDRVPVEPGWGVADLTPCATCGHLTEITLNRCPNCGTPIAVEDR